MTTAAKDRTRKCFRILHQNFMTALAGAACLYHPENLDCLTRGAAQAAIIGPNGKGTAFPLTDIKRALETNKKAVISSFVKMNFRVVMLESYEALKRYCKETGQYEHPLKDQPWFHFFRLVRNAMGHDTHFTFSARDKKILPVSWKGATIHEGLEGMPVTFDVLNLDTAFDLLQAAEEFLITGLE